MEKYIKFTSIYNLANYIYGIFINDMYLVTKVKKLIEMHKDEIKKELTVYELIFFAYYSNNLPKF